jgi:hypothetical protein
MSEHYPPEDQPTRRRPSLKGRRAPVERIPWAAIEQPEDRPGEAQPQAEQPAAIPIPRREPRSSGLYIPWWGFAIVILAVAGITCGLWGFVLWNRGDAATNAGPTPTPIFVVITATPTLGPSGEKTPQPGDEGVPPSEGGPAADVPIPGVTPTTETTIPIQVGRTVIVTGTEGDGLSIRQGPGLSFTTFFVGDEGQLFLVQDGPREADGYVWWYIVDLNDAELAGWSVDKYLEVAVP